MPQTANVNGGQVVFGSQATPMNIESSYVNVTWEVVGKFKHLGLMHLAIGISCIVFQVISLAVDTSTSSFGAPGIWTGSLFAVTGVLGIIAGKKGNRCKVITFNVLSTTSAVFSIILLGIAAKSAVDAMASATHYYYGNDSSIAAFVMELLLIILAFVELIIAVFSSVTRCTVGAWCVDFLLPYCSSTDPQYCQFNNPVEPDLAQQHFIAIDQQQPVCNTNQQQQVLKSNQQQPMCNTNQQQPMFNTNQQQLMFNTAQQQPVFNLNQQQLLFNPSQQQPMFNTNQQQLLLFNSNQQQLMCFTTQPLTGFNPGQQAVQYVLWPNTPINYQQSELSASLSGGTGQGSVADLHSKLMTTPLLEKITEPPRAGNSSDDEPVFTDDVEMLSRESPFGDSENGC